MMTGAAASYLCQWKVQRWSPQEQGHPVCRLQGPQRHHPCLCRLHHRCLSHQAGAWLLQPEPAGWPSLLTHLRSAISHDSSETEAFTPCTAGICRPQTDTTVACAMVGVPKPSEPSRYDKSYAAEQQRCFSLPALMTRKAERQWPHLRVEVWRWARRPHLQHPCWW